jgi:CRISPR-associated endonuclease/helicase Cas3
MRDQRALYYQYWGKAKVNDSGEVAYHLLPYHCLDVVAVADIWWQSSPSIRHSFKVSTRLSEEQARGWLMFFIALHDYGKFDFRFQCKAPEAWRQVNSELSSVNRLLSIDQVRNYYHGSAGLYWFYQDNNERFGQDDDDFCFDDNDEWESWLSWLAPVAGHHGVIPDDYEKGSEDYLLPRAVSEPLREQLKQARLQWLKCLADLFLSPAGLCLDHSPPLFDTTKNGQSAATMLAGFCSVCDWLGSSDFFNYDNQPCANLEKLKLWYQQRLLIAETALKAAGVIGEIKPYQNIDILLKKGNSPRQVQCLVNNLHQGQNLTLIEASTGSGKTEAALAYAWQLLALGQAESIVFALPTQATANAMLKRLEEAAPLLFAQEMNVVLAHGRAGYQQTFIDLKQACESKPAQGKEEAWVQCGLWLSQSRKRVFLGQIGVCTVDQVLVSVLPVKHKFVRGFGIGRSVLIIDEVHAYDSYMYGLLEAVLTQQRLAGGSAILLSATLPFHQKQQLARAWGNSLDDDNTAYPLITQCHANEAEYFDLNKSPEQQPTKLEIQLDLLKLPHLLPDHILLKRLLQAVVDGAQVCLVCNLVADAQAIYQTLLEQVQSAENLTADQILLFHSRFTFKDRQQKEQAVLNLFGAEPQPKEVRNKGHLLVATQVVEQSLDLDFDWLVTQLCPVDLLFQRMGRLHRHKRNRPNRYQSPCCTVLLPKSDDYELHELIYGNSRVLWRTQQLLQKAKNIVCFPKAYRDWIEPVYKIEEWQDEPETIIKSFEKFEQESEASRYNALRIVRDTPGLDDSDGNVMALTRDGEMSLSILPCYRNQQGYKCLLNEDVIETLEEAKYFETLNLNSVAVPASWGKYERLDKPDKEGVIWLEMEQIAIEHFLGVVGDYEFTYQPETGLSRRETSEENV